MSTTIRPELSEKNQYWIDKHRYYELKHFLFAVSHMAKILCDIGWVSKQLAESNSTV